MHKLALEGDGGLEIRTGKAVVAAYSPSLKEQSLLNPLEGLS